MTFVVVNYGDNQQKLFNPECRTRFLIDNIKERCNYPKEIDVELSDEHGNVKNIWRSDEAYASSVLTVERESLVLLQVKRVQQQQQASSGAAASRRSKQLHRSTNHDDVLYVPLLNNEKIVTSKFTARLSSRDDRGVGGTGGGTSEHRTPRNRSTARSDARRGGGGKELRRSAEDASVVIPHPNTPLSSRKRVNGGSRTPSSSRSKSRGKQR